MNVCSYLLCGGKKKKSFKEPQIIFRGGGLKGWLLLNHAASKGDKTPIFPTTKHETIRKNGKYSQNGEARNRTVKGTFSLKHVSSSLDFQSHFKSFVHITCSWHTPPFFWPFCLITFSSSQRATENEKTDHKRDKESCELHILPSIHKVFHKLSNIRATQQFSFFFHLKAITAWNV